MRAIALFLALAGSAAALTVEEVLQLSEAGVPDEIIIDQMEADGSVFQLSAAEIIKLQNRKVSPVVIKFMVTTRGGQAPAADPGDAAPAPAAEPDPATESWKDASLTVRNVSKRILSVQVHAREGEIVLVEGEINDATVLFNGSHTVLPVSSGLFRVRWANEDPFRELAVVKGVATELEFRDDDRFSHGIRAVAIVDGKEEADPYALPAPEESVDPGDGAAPVDVIYVEGAEPVWDGHAFIEVPSHVHGDGCGHWYYDNCWNLYPETHVYIQVGYSRCRDTGGFFHHGEPWARVWDGWAFLFLRGHVHGAGCGHYYHHRCWNLFSNNHVFSEHGRRHFNPCPPRTRVAVSPSRIGRGTSLKERAVEAPADSRRTGSEAQRVEPPARRQEPNRVEPPARRQEPKRVEPPARRQEPKRVEPPARRQEPNRVEPPARRQEPKHVEPPARRHEPKRVEPPARRQEPNRVEPPARRPEPKRVEPPARRPEPKRVEPPARRQEPQRTQQPPRREAPQGQQAPRQRTPDSDGRGKRR